MALTQSQKSLIERAQAAGGGELGTGLSNDACGFLVATMIRDLGLVDRFPEIADKDFPGFFEETDPRKLELQGLAFLDLGVSFQKVGASKPRPVSRRDGQSN